MNKKHIFKLTKVVTKKRTKATTEPVLSNEKQTLTNLSVEDLFLSVANWFNDFEEGLEESEVTQPPSFIIELLPLCFLQAGKKQGRCSIYPTFFFMRSKGVLI